MSDEPATNTEATPAAVEKIQESTRDAAGRFRKGVSGNRKGRPKDSGWACRIRGQLREAALPVLVALHRAAVAGDSHAAGVLLSRVLPPMRPNDEPVSIKLKRDMSRSQRAEAIAAAAASGEIAPAAATEALAHLESVSRIVAVDELALRVAALEAAARGDVEP